MKVCHITSAHPRHDMRICEKECVSLAKKGYDVYLVVDDAEKNEEYKGIHIISTGYKGGGRIQRFIKAPKRVLNKALSVDAAVYQLHDPELLSITKALLKAGKKVIYDAHEDTEKQINTKHYIPKAIRPLISKIYSLYSYDKFQKITALISVTPAIVHKLKKFNNNVAMITNYPIVDVNADIHTKTNICVGKQAPDETDKNNYVFFAGGVSEQWCHENIIEAVEKVDGVKYLYAGRGREDYLHKLQMIGLGNKYLGVLSHDEVMKCYKNAIAGMAVLKTDTQVGKDGTLGNTKMFEVMEAGRPVICSNLKLWKEIIDRYKCGICVNPDDPMAIADAIRYLQEHLDEGDEMGRNGRKAVELEFNWATQEKELYDFYKKIADLP